MFLFIPLIGLLVTLALIYFLGQYNEAYWKKRGVAYYSKNKVTGPWWDFLTSDQSVFLCLYNLYKTYRDEPAVGIGAIGTPTLYVIDLDNIQHVLQSDFRSFNHRGMLFAKNDKLADHLLFQTGEKWKLMRQAMTPLFTNNKLRNMYYIIDKSAQDFVKYLIDDPSKRTGDVYDTLTSFCAAAVSGAVFGITTKSIFDSPFVKIAKETLAPTKYQNFLFALINLRYDALRKLGINTFNQSEDFFIGAIKQVLRQREKEPVGTKHDFADLAVALQKQGKLVDKDTGFELEMTDEILAGQAFFYYFAGIETTAAAMYAVLIELGRRPEMLEKVNKEIDEAFLKGNGELTFDNIKDMEFLDKVLSESMRLHPSVGFLTRQAIKDSVLPVGNIIVEAGTRLFIPIYEIHHDTKYYPNPEEFDPERFSPENKYKYDNAYLPFGKGGRLCIGMAFAKAQAKAGLIHLMRHFDVKTTILPGGIKYSKQQIQVRPINLKVDLIYKEEE